MSRFLLAALACLIMASAVSAQTLGWLPASDGLPAGAPLSLIADTTGLVAAGTLGGPYRLRPDDPTWTEADGPKEELWRLAAGPGGRFYAVADSAVLVTTDGARTWERRSTPGYVATWGLAAPGGTAEEVVYAYIQGNPACGEGRSGLEWHRSGDGGRTWTCLADTTVVGNARDLISTSSGTLLAAGSSGASRSEDGGRTWTPVYAAPRSPRFGGTSGPYVALSGRYLVLHLSVDDGRTWRSTDVSGSPVGLAVDADGDLYVGLQTVTQITFPNTFRVYYGGVHRSDDGGRTWTRTAFGEGLDDPGVLSMTSYGGGVLVGSWRGAFWSGDGGQTWVPLGEGLRAQWTLDIAFGPDGDAYTATYPRQLHRLEGGDEQAEWEPVELPAFDRDLIDYGRSSRFGVPRIELVRVGPDGTVYVIDGNLLRLRPDTDEWEARPVGFILEDLVIEADGSLLAGAAAQGVHRSRDGGDTWERIGDELPDIGGADAVVTLPDGRVVGGGRFGLYQRAPRDQRWYDTGIGPFEVFDLAVGDDGVAYAVGREWVEVADEAVAMDQSEGETIEVVTGEVLVFPDGTVMTGGPEAASGANQRLRSYAGTRYRPTNRGAIFRSSTRRRSWERLAVDASPLRAVAVDETGRIYAGHLVSDDRGQTWAPSGGGLRGEYVAALDVAPDGRTWAATHGGGVYRSALAFVGTEDDEAHGDDRLGVYPNPARGSATVSLTLDRAYRNAEVGIYDALGRRVAVVHSGPLVAGDHAMAPDLDRLAPGVYIIRAQIDGATRARPLVIVR